jgi:HD-GYP domain-containing protein (c-di-GMP phosphodiesterase class II)
MVKISDIFVFKKLEPKKKDDVPAAQPVTPLEPVTAVSEEREMERETVSEPKPPSSEECQETYDEALALIGEIIKENALYELIDYSRIVSVMEKFIDIVQVSPEGMLNLALTFDKDHYIKSHSVNVTIISIIVGLELGYDKSRLRELALGAFLHDAGMVDYLALVEVPRKLTAEEYNKVKNHTIFGARILQKISGLPDICITVGKQHHERIDGSGYPEGLSGDDIHEYAKIVGMADMYEAMMHPRKYRPEFPNLETMQEILKSKKSFEYRLIKIIISKIGIFPIGSLVELNTKEIARVVKLNREINLRPVVKIICNSKREPVTESKTLDLAIETAIWIKKGVKE